MSTLSVKETVPVGVKSQEASLIKLASDVTFLTTCLYFTLGITVTPFLSKVGADNRAAAMYFPANSPA